MKNVKNVVFAFILCAFLTTTSNKKVSIFGIFFVVLCSLDYFSNKKRCFNKANAVTFLEKYLVGDGALDRCFCRGTKKLSVRIILKKTKSSKNK